MGIFEPQLPSSSRIKTIQIVILPRPSGIFTNGVSALTVKATPPVIPWLCFSVRRCRRRIRGRPARSGAKYAALLYMDLRGEFAFIFPVRITGWSYRYYCITSWSTLRAALRKFAEGICKGNGGGRKEKSEQRDVMDCAEAFRVVLIRFLV